MRSRKSVQKTSYLVVPRTNAILCDALMHLFRRAEDVDCQSLTGDIHQIRWMMATSEDAICILDDPSPALIRALRETTKRPRTVVLVPSDIRAFPLRSVMTLDPHAVVSYEASLQELGDAIDATSRGERSVGASLRGVVKVDPARGKMVSGSSSPLDQLTKRQLEVARWLAEGYTIAEVAEIMALAEKTVESHRYRIMGRLNLASRVELTRLLVQEAVVPRQYVSRSEREARLPVDASVVASAGRSATVTGRDLGASVAAAALQ